MLSFYNVDKEFARKKERGLPFEVTDLNDRMPNVGRAIRVASSEHLCFSKVAAANYLATYFLLRHSYAKTSYRRRLLDICHPNRNQELVKKNFKINRGKISYSRLRRRTPRPHPLPLLLLPLPYSRRHLPVELPAHKHIYQPVPSSWNILHLRWERHRFCTAYTRMIDTFLLTLKKINNFNSLSINGKLSMSFQLRRNDSLTPNKCK